MFGRKRKAVKGKLESIERKVEHLTESVRNKHVAVMLKLAEISAAVSKPQKTISLVWVRRVREPIPTAKG